MFRKSFLKRGIALSLVTAFSLSQMSVNAFAVESDKAQVQEEIQKLHGDENEVIPKDVKKTSSEKSNTPLEKNSTPLEKSNTPLEKSNTPLESSNAPSEKSDTLQEKSKNKLTEKKSLSEKESLNDDLDANSVESEDELDEEKSVKTKSKRSVSNYLENGDFETGDFSGWTHMDGTEITNSNNSVGVVSDEKTYWGSRSMYVHGNYCMRGESKENESGAIRSSSFKLGGDGYISFMIGAAATEEKGCIKVYKETDNGDELVKTYTNKNWSDPKTGLTLIRVFDRLENNIGDTLYFVIENGSGAGFSFINADDFRTSMTREDVISLQNSQLKDIENVEDEYSDYIINCYKKNGIINDIIIKKDIPAVLEKYAGLEVDFIDLIKSETEIIEEYTGKKVDLDVVINDITFNGKALDNTGKQIVKEGKYIINYTRSYDGKTEDKTLTLNVVKVDNSVRE